MSPLTIEHVVQLHPRVSVRPEPFGALLYHFGTRRLSFLKDLTLLAVVRQLDGIRPLGEAMDAAGVRSEDHTRYLRALSALAASSMIVPSDASEVAA